MRISRMNPALGLAIASSMLLCGCSKAISENREAATPSNKNATPVVTQGMDGPWVVGQGVSGGKPLFESLNVGLKKIAGSSNYPFQVDIVLPLNSPREDGLPLGDELEELNKIEDTLCDKLLPTNLCVFAARITTNGTRELLFYTGNPEKVKSYFGSIQKSIKSHTLRLTIQKDASWQVYNSLQPEPQ
jgi:hypothetical protein